MSSFSNLSSLSIQVYFTKFYLNQIWLSSLKKNIEQFFCYINVIIMIEIRLKQI